MRKLLLVVLLCPMMSWTMEREAEESQEPAAAATSSTTDEKATRRKKLRRKCSMAPSALEGEVPALPPTPAPTESCESSRAECEQRLMEMVCNAFREQSSVMREQSGLLQKLVSSNTALIAAMERVNVLEERGARAAEAQLKVRLLLNALARNPNDGRLLIALNELRREYQVPEELLAAVAQEEAVSVPAAVSTGSETVSAAELVAESAPADSAASEETAAAAAPSDAEHAQAAPSATAVVADSGTTEAVISQEPVASGGSQEVLVEEPAVVASADEQAPVQASDQGSAQEPAATADTVAKDDVSAVAAEVAAPQDQAAAEGSQEAPEGESAVVASADEQAPVQVSDQGSAQEPAATADTVAEDTASAVAATEAAASQDQAAVGGSQEAPVGEATVVASADEQAPVQASDQGSAQEPVAQVADTAAEDAAQASEPVKGVVQEIVVSAEADSSAVECDAGTEQDTAGDNSQSTGAQASSVDPAQQEQVAAVTTGETVVVPTMVSQDAAPTSETAAEQATAQDSDGAVVDVEPQPTQVSQDAAQPARVGCPEGCNCPPECCGPCPGYEKSKQ